MVASPCSSWRGPNAAWANPTGTPSSVATVSPAFSKYGFASTSCSNTSADIGCIGPRSGGWERKSRPNAAGRCCEKSGKRSMRSFRAIHPRGVTRLSRSTRIEVPSRRRSNRGCTTVRDNWLWPLRTSNCQPCQGQVTIGPSKQPLPSGPPWWGQMPSEHKAFRPHEQGHNAVVHHPLQANAWRAIGDVGNRQPAGHNRIVEGQVARG